MAAQIFLLPFRPAIGPNSLVIPGAQLFFYYSTTLNKANVYTDATLATPLPNPVVANSAGVWPKIYYDTATIYRVILSGPDNAALADVDPYLIGSIDNYTFNSDVLAAITGISAAATSAGLSRDAALISRNQAAGFATQTGLDAAATASDRVQTGLDRGNTGSDRTQTGLDRIATAADRVTTTADRIQTGLDRGNTGADRVQTGLDAAATAADRVQTGLDRASATASAATAVAISPALVAGFANVTTNCIQTQQVLIDHIAFS